MRLVYVNNDEEVSVSGRLAAASRAGLAEAGGQGGVVAPGLADRLTRQTLTGGEQAGVWWLGAHGGAGESTLEDLICGSRAAGHSWPLPAPGDRPPHVVLVARTHAHGLRAAQLAVREWAAGDVEVLLLGLVLIADAPGRLPAALRRLAQLVAGGVPVCWQLPWVEAWRVGEPPGPGNAPKVARRLLEELRVMTEASASASTHGKE